MADDTMTLTAKIIAVYSIGLAVVGTIGNFCGFLLCLRKNLRQIPTFIFTAFTLVADMISLYFWNIDHYLFAFHGYMMEEVNIEVCKIVTFLQGFSLQWSAWLLVFMTVERYLSVRVKRWRTVYFKAKTAVIMSIILGTIILLINLTLTRFIQIEDGSVNKTCLDLEIYSKYLKVNIVLYGLLPYAFIMISNILLTHCILSNVELLQQRSENRSKRKSISFTVITLTTLFIFATLPVNIVNAFFVPDIFMIDFGFNILFILDCLAFTCHAFSFLTLIMTNKIFLKEMKTCINSIKNSNRIGSF